MEPMELFEKVATHLLAQNKRAANERGCQYRVEGLRCAVGCLISDENYSKLIEGTMVCALYFTEGRWCAHRTLPKPFNRLAEALNAEGVPATPETRTLLSRLQYLHDNLPQGAWPEALNKLRAELQQRKV
jgi:hypothetical protein